MNVFKKFMIKQKMPKDISTQGSVTKYCLKNAFKKKKYLNDSVDDRKF